MHVQSSLQLLECWASHPFLCELPQKLQLGWVASALISPTKTNNIQKSNKSQMCKREFNKNFYIYYQK
jgi:hypothetical protein